MCMLRFHARAGYLQHYETLLKEINAHRVGQCRSPQWRRRGPGSGSVPGRTLWRGGGCLAERGAKARVAGGRVAAPGTLRLARLGTRGPLAGTLVARLGSVGRRPDAAGPQLTARGALTARVPRGTDSDGAKLTTLKKTSCFLTHPERVRRDKIKAVQLLCMGYYVAKSNFKTAQD
jgi:hypothetical protein